jgi:hypothetical protein
MASAEHWSGPPQEATDGYREDDEALVAEDWLRESAATKSEERQAYRARPQKAVRETIAKPAGTRVEYIIKIVAAVINTETTRRIPVGDIYSLLFGYIDDAAAAVSALQKRADEVWDRTRLNQALLAELLRIGRIVMKTHFDSGIGDILLEQMSAGALIPAACPAAPVGGAGPVSLDGRARTTLSIDSSSRNMALGALPNVIQVPLLTSPGLSLPSALLGAYRAELLEIKMNNSAIFTERPCGSTFYVMIDELVKDYNRQSDPYDIHCQFKCAAKPDLNGSGVEILILTKWVYMPTPIDLGGNITARLLDDQKIPLAVEQDIYPYISYVWDDVNQAIVFETARNSIQNADRIDIRNIVCTEDVALFDNTKKLRAEVVDLTHIRVYAWRAQGAPFMLPDDGRHIVSTGGHIICLNNVIRLSLAIEHLA